MENGIKLEIRGLGHVPGKKNKHYAGGGRVLIDKETKEKVERIVLALESQLLSVIQAELKETTPTAMRPLLTALFKRSPEFDDEWTCLAQEILSGISVEKGEEGADLVVELISRNVHSAELI